MSETSMTPEQTARRDTYVAALAGITADELREAHPSVRESFRRTFGEKADAAVAVSDAEIQRNTDSLRASWTAEVDLVASQRDELRAEIEQRTRVARENYDEHAATLDELDRLRAELAARPTRAEVLRIKAALLDLHPKMAEPRHGCCGAPKLCNGHPAECRSREHGIGDGTRWPCATLRAAGITCDEDAAEVRRMAEAAERVDAGKDTPTGGEPTRAATDGSCDRCGEKPEQWCQKCAGCACPGGRPTTHAAGGSCPTAPAGEVTRTRAAAERETDVEPPLGWVPTCATGRRTGRLCDAHDGDLIRRIRGEQP